MKKILFLILFFITLIPALSFGQISTTSRGYIPLEPLPGISEANQPVNFDTFISGLFRFSIGFAAALAVVMIIVGGIQYLSTDAWQGKSEGKERIKNALAGLLLAISSWIILNTINPELTSINLSLPSPNVDFTGGIDPCRNADGSRNNECDSQGNPVGPGQTMSGQCKFRTQTGEITNVACTCDNCSNISNYQKVRTQNSAIYKLALNKNLLEKLTKFDELVRNTDLKATYPGYKDESIWYITEGWMPTYAHKDSCNLNGTCTDISSDLLRNRCGSSTTNINRNTPHPCSRLVKTFLEVGRRAGLTMLFEVKDNEEYLSYVRGGLRPNTDIKRFDWVTGPHFSVE